MERKLSWDIFLQTIELYVQNTVWNEKRMNKLNQTGFQQILIDPI